MEVGRFLAGLSTVDSPEKKNILMGNKQSRYLTVRLDVPTCVFCHLLHTIYVPATGSIINKQISDFHSLHGPGCPRKSGKSKRGVSSR